MTFHVILGYFQNFQPKILTKSIHEIAKNTAYIYFYIF